MIASSYPQLSGLAPQAERVAQNAADVIGLASRTTSSPDQQQQPNAIDLDVVRESIDRIATSIASSQGRMTSSADRMATTQEEIARSVDRMTTTQEQIARSMDRIATTQGQIARSVDQLRADQEQMTREITKLQEIGQSIRVKNSESSPRPASAQKPVSRPASASVPKPVSPTLPESTAPWPGPIYSW
jgi:chromosome segregation ATPase